METDVVNVAPSILAAYFLPTSMQKIRRVRQMMEKTESRCDVEVDEASIETLLGSRLLPELMFWWPKSEFW